MVEIDLVLQMAVGVCTLFIAMAWSFLMASKIAPKRAIDRLAEKLADEKSKESEVFGVVVKRAAPDLEPLKRTINAQAELLDQRWLDLPAQFDAAVIRFFASERGREMQLLGQDSKDADARELLQKAGRQAQWAAQHPEEAQQGVQVEAAETFLMEFIEKEAAKGGYSKTAINAAKRMAPGAVQKFFGAQSGGGGGGSSTGPAQF